MDIYFDQSFVNHLACSYLENTKENWAILGEEHGIVNVVALDGEDNLHFIMVLYNDHDDNFPVEPKFDDDLRAMFEMCSMRWIRRHHEFDSMVNIYFDIMSLVINMEEENAFIRFHIDAGA